MIQFLSFFFRPARIFFIEGAEGKKSNFNKTDHRRKQQEEQKSYNEFLARDLRGI